MIFPAIGKVHAVERRGRNASRPVPGFGDDIGLDRTSSERHRVEMLAVLDLSHPAADLRRRLRDAEQPDRLVAGVR